MSAPLTKQETPTGSGRGLWSLEAMDRGPLRGYGVGCRFWWATDRRPLAGSVVKLRLNRISDAVGIPYP